MGKEREWTAGGLHAGWERMDSSYQWEMARVGVQAGLHASPFPASSSQILFLFP